MATYRGWISSLYRSCCMAVTVMAMMADEARVLAATSLSTSTLTVFDMKCSESVNVSRSEVPLTTAKPRAR